MTLAICMNCGEKKHGAWTKCNQCNFIPSEIDEIVDSVLMTDHYFDVNGLDSISKTIKSGMRPRFDISPKQREELRKNAEFFRVLQNKMFSR